jgi:hypothetical protein
MDDDAARRDRLMSGLIEVVPEPAGEPTTLIYRSDPLQAVSDICCLPSMLPPYLSTMFMA